MDIFDFGQGREHKPIYEHMTVHLENVPGLQPIHYFLYERAAYLYLQCVQAEDEKVEKAYLGMFIDVMNEIGRETRNYSKDEAVQDALIYTVSGILRSELSDNGELLNRIIRRLKEL